MNFVRCDECGCADYGTVHDHEEGCSKQFVNAERKGYKAGLQRAIEVVEVHCKNVRLLRTPQARHLAAAGELFMGLLRAELTDPSEEK